VTCHPPLPRYFSRLKAFSIAFFIPAAAILLIGCADPLEQPMVQEVPEKLQRGITGGGQLQPLDRSDDPYIRGNHP
jgi:hypothetical protein